MLPVLIKKSVPMIHVGRINHLIVKDEFPFGYQLALSDDDDDVVTLPSSTAPRGLKIGDELDVFVATDEQGQLIGSVKTPLIQLGEVKVLKAVGATAFGGFFDWGLERDLLVPANYQESPINPGMHYVVTLFFEETTNRLLGATRLHHFLKERTPDLEVNQTVNCLVYAKTDLGFKVVINEQYLGLIFHSDAYKKLHVGEETTGVIKQIREDGKIDVGLQRIDATGRKSLEQAILDDLEAHGGVSTLTDKSPPDEIYARFDVSKAAYKKALGALFKRRLILLDKQTVRLTKP